MNTNNSTGRGIAVLIGGWFIVKWILNLIISGGFDFVGLLIALAVVVLGFIGIKYTNYAIAGVAVIIVLMHLLGNIKGLFHLESMLSSVIYLAEAAVDLICAAILCLVPSVKEHFSNGFSDN